MGLVLWSLITRKTPKFHEKRPVFDDFWKVIRQRVVPEMADKETIKQFQQDLNNIQNNGPLALEISDSNSGIFLNNFPLFRADPRRFPEEEKTLLAKFGLVPSGHAAETTSSEETDSLDGYLTSKAKLVGLMCGQEENSMAMKIFEMARGISVNAIANNDWRKGSRLVDACIAADGSSLPLFRNEVIHWTATINAALISMILEYVLQSRRHLPRQSRADVEVPLLKMGSEGRWINATVGDLIWMRILYGRYVTQSKDKIMKGFVLPLLERNPLFVLENIDTALQYYPDDQAAKEQMLFFLATCSHAFRKSLLESLFLTKPEEVLWQAYRRARKWVEFLRDRVRDWAANFEPPSSGASSIELGQARDFLLRVVNLWETHTLLLGSAQIRFLPPKTAIPADIQEFYSNAQLEESAAGEHGEWFVKRVFAAVFPAGPLSETGECGKWFVKAAENIGIWMNTPLVPVPFDEASVWRFLRLPPGLPEQSVTDEDT